MAGRAGDSSALFAFVAELRTVLLYLHLCRMSRKIICFSSGKNKMNMILGDESNE